MKLEEALRGVVLGLLAPTIVLAVVTVPFAEPPIHIQFLQVAHAYLGLVLVPAAAAYLFLHLAQTIDFRHAWRRARGPSIVARRRSVLRTAGVLATVAGITSLFIVVVFAPLLHAYRGHSPAASRGAELEVRFLLMVGNAIAIAVAVTALAVRRYGLAPFNLRWLAVAAATACGATGLWYTIFPPTAHHHVNVVAVAHVVSAPCAIVLAALHVGHARRAAESRRSDAAARSYRWARPALLVGLPVAVLASSVTVVLPRVAGPRFAAAHVDPRMLRPVDANFAEMAPGGCESCHGGESETWAASAHAHAAANPVFEALIQRAVAAGRADVARWCLGCHAPHALDPTRAELDEVIASPGFRSGVHCLSCHRADDVSAAGDGVLSVRPLSADRFTFIQDFPGEPAATIRHGYTPYALVASRLPAHRRSFRFHTREPAVCRPCHVQTLTSPTEQRSHAVLQDQFDSWQRSPAAAQGQSCAHCHMPMYRNQFGVRIVDHRMRGASTYLARVAEGAAGEEAMSAWLRGENVSGPRSLLDPTAPEPGPLLAIDAELLTDGPPRLRIRSRNTGRIGHSFPNGPTDLFEVWLVARVADRGGTRERLAIGESGPSGAVSLGSRLKDDHGDPITDHRLWEVAQVEDAGHIPERGEHVADLEIPGGALEPPVEVSAAWRYRRLRPDLVESLTGKRLDLPVVELARWTGTVPVPAKNP